MSGHLWEVEHDYYCRDTSYNSDKDPTFYASWGDFFEEEGNSDFDYDLIFRWDWKLINEAEEGIDIDEAEKYDLLYLYFMGQRKGCFRVVHVRVDKKDEDKIKEFLQKRFDYLVELWAPFKTEDLTK